MPCSTVSTANYPCRVLFSLHEAGAESSLGLAKGSLWDMDYDAAC